MTRILTENATLVARHDLDPTLSVFRVRPDRIPSPDQTWFEPGQYVTLGMSAREGPEEQPLAFLRPSRLLQNFRSRGAPAPS